MRRITLCADDYGLSAGVNRGIRDLIEKRRLSATSVMAVGPAATRGEIDDLLAAAKAADGFSIGLHLTLTAPFHPLTFHFRPLRSGEFLSLSRLLGASLMRRLDVEILQAEIAAQLAAFESLIGRPPDYVDGHQHVQLFPQIRDAFVQAVADAAPKCWVRQCGRAAAAPPGDFKTRLLDRLSRGFRKSAAAAGLRANPAFAGAYDFKQRSDFGSLFARFLEGLPDGGLVMCHPGFVDATLIALDPLTDQRKVEYDWLMSDAFPALLESNNVALA